MKKKENEQERLLFSQTISNIVLLLNIYNKQINEKNYDYLKEIIIKLKISESNMIDAMLHSASYYNDVKILD